MADAMSRAAGGETESPPHSKTVMLAPLPFRTDGGIAARAAIGLIVLATDYTIEHEWRRLLALDGVAYYQSRIWNEASITPQTLRAMAPRIQDAAGVILPGAKLDVMAFGCTSAAMAIGEEAVFAEIRKARPHIACTTPITAAFAAFAALGARRIGLLTPYRADVNEIVADYVRARGFDVPVFGSFNEEDDRVVARIDGDSVRAGIAALLAKAKLDALFVSCTSVRLAGVAAQIEAEIGIPVTSSNHAMAWHALRLAGIEDAQAQFGRLFTRPLSNVS